MLKLGRALHIIDKNFMKKSGKLRGAVMLAGPMLARFRKGQAKRVARYEVIG